MPRKDSAVTTGSGDFHDDEDLPWSSNYCTQAPALPVDVKSAGS